MPEVALVSITPELAEELARPGELELRRGLHLGDSRALVAEVVAQTEAQRRAAGADPEWGGYLAVDAATREVVGSCAFKGAPDAAGAVEIAYFTFPAFERHGFATAMARALERHATASHRVRVLVAHTLPEENASTRVLRKLGFARAGEASDPEVGRVWRWERRLA